MCGATPPLKPKYPYSQSQRDYIETTRDSVIKNGTHFFQSHDWRMIISPTGKCSSLAKPVHADDFYICPVAVWVPLILLENFIPSCPHCKQNKFVDPSKARWVNSHKLLCGVKGHRHLDTLLCPCHVCKGSFAGYNPQSMEVDSAHFKGYFNFHFSGRFAVDEELYSLITSNHDLTAAKLHRMLDSMAVDTYLNDYMLYLHAVGQKKIKLTRHKVASNDRTQRTLHDTGAEVRPQLSALEREMRGLKNDIRSKELSLRVTESRLNDPVCFKDLRQQKLGRNKRDQQMSGVGHKNLEQLMSVGIMNAKQLLAHDAIPECWCW